MILGLRQTSQVFQISQIMYLASSDPSRRNGQAFKLDKGRGRNPGMVQTQVTAQGWLGSTPEGRRPQIRGWRAGGSLAVASSTPATPLLSPAKIPGVEPCLIPCGPSLSLSRLLAWPVLRCPLLERPGIGSAWQASQATKCYVFPAFSKIWKSGFRRKLLMNRWLWLFGSRRSFRR